MDEVDFARAFKNLNVLIEQVSHVDARNALKVVAHLIQGLNDRITELQLEEDDTDE